MNAPRGSDRSGAGRPAPSRQGGADLAPRIVFAIPAILFAILIVWQGGEVFAIGLALLGVMALGELYVLMGRVRPPALAGFVTLIALLVAALYGEPKHVIMVLVASLPLTFFLALMRPRREHVSWAIAAVLFGILWIGLPMVHAVWLRELPHGDGLLVDVLVATFVGDTFAYFGGRWYGSRRIAPLISPNKTLEGLVAGFVGATMAFWFAGLYQDWLTGWHALVMGALVAFAAPIGDLFESMIKRDLEVKDTGTLFGPHGGVLDRLDAAFFTIVVAYYAAVALGYG
ncbi:MAG TPA: phosphatidate cytidylyltransferase [Thermoleophilaceae bacterium]|nr:phosphatidate cytidylyltransferase [Thermoleophilaceae bacterium]